MANVDAKPGQAPYRCRRDAEACTLFRGEAHRPSRPANNGAKMTLSAELSHEARLRCLACVVVEAARQSAAVKIPKHAGGD